MYIVLKQPRVADGRGVRPVTGGANPAVHPTAALAISEAERLCENNPTNEYLVFSAVARVKITGNPTVTEKIGG